MKSYQPVFADVIGPWVRHFAWLPVDTVDEGWRWMCFVYRRRCQPKLTLPGPNEWWWQYVRRTDR